MGDRDLERTVSDDDWPVDDLYLVTPPEAPPAGYEPPREGAHAPGRRRPAPRRAAALFLVALFLLILAIAIAWLGPSDNPSQATPREPASPSGTTPLGETGATATPAASTLPVTDVTGLQLAAARARLERAGFRVRFTRQESELPTDRVLRQTPPGDGEAEPNAIVVLTVSAGPGLVSVPRVVGLSAHAASTKLRAVELRPRPRLVRSTAPAGKVVKQSPAAGARIEPGAVVTLLVARPGPRVRVPDLIGGTAAAARQTLTALGLRTSSARVPSDQPEGTVVGQSPAAGAGARKGSSVRIEVSSGPTMVSVPSVVGLDEPSARAELEAAGFKAVVETEPTTDPAQDGMVTAQTPSGDSRAAKGSVVTITVARLG